MNWVDYAEPWVGTPAKVERLPGGLTNHVFRASGPKGTVILKSAPDYLAAAPAIALSPKRLTVEAAALELAQRHNTNEVQIPTVLHFDQTENILILQDLADGPTLRQSKNLRTDLDDLAAWLKALHLNTRDLPDLPDFGVHAARAASQYEAISNQIKYSNKLFSEELIWAANYFSSSPDCLVMGDLWMPSILKRDKLFVIDWEFAAHGHSEQDVAHLAAHLFLSYGSAFESHFLEAYDRAAWTEIQHRAFHAHRGAELLQRTIGAFPGTGGASAKSPAQMRAVAERWLLQARRVT